MMTGESQTLSQFNPSACRSGQLGEAPFGLPTSRTCAASSLAHAYQRCTFCRLNHIAYQGGPVLGHCPAEWVANYCEHKVVAPHIRDLQVQRVDAPVDAAARQVGMQSVWHSYHQDTRQHGACLTRRLREQLGHGMRAPNGWP